METDKVEAIKFKTKHLPSPRFLYTENPLEDDSGNLITTISPKCSHKNPGEWVVGWHGTFYSFLPQQRNIWLNAAGEKNVDTRIKLLKWHCFECKNIQEP